MDIYQFVNEIGKIMEQIKELDKQAPKDCSALLGIIRACSDELGNGYYFDPPKWEVKSK